MDSKKITGDSNKTTEAILKVCQELGISHVDLYKRAGLDDGNWSKLTKGKRKWNLRQLKKLAHAAGVPVYRFFSEIPTIPIVGEVSATEGFHIQTNTTTLDLGYAKSLFTEGVVDWNRVYAIRVKDRSLLPSYPPQTIFYALKESHRDIKNEQLVVFSDGNGNARVRQIIMAPDTIILRGLNPAVPDETYPRHFLKLCDRIIHATF